MTCLKLRYPERVQLIRGNHETRAVTQVSDTFLPVPWSSMARLSGGSTQRDIEQGRLEAIKDERITPGTNNDSSAKGPQQHVSGSGSCTLAGFVNKPLILSCVCSESASGKMEDLKVWGGDNPGEEWITERLQIALAVLCGRQELRIWIIADFLLFQFRHMVSIRNAYGNTGRRWCGSTSQTCSISSPSAW